MNSHPYARAIPSAFYSTTQAVINANRRIPDDSIMTIPYTEARAKSSQKNFAPQKSSPALLTRHKTTPRPSGKILLEESGVTLTLCGQRDYARKPSYGRCAVVDGILSFDNPDNILKVEAKIEGHVSVRELAGNGSAKTKVLSEELVFWDAPMRLSDLRCQKHQYQRQLQASSTRSPDPRSPTAWTPTTASVSSPSPVFIASEQCPASISFKATLPSHYTDERGERTPLPPSFIDGLAAIPGFRVGVKYAIIVTVTQLREQKQKLCLKLNVPWRDKTKNVVLEAPIEYVPRTSPSMVSPFPPNSNPAGSTPLTCFMGSIESRDVHTQPLKTQVYLPNAQLVPLNRSMPFFINVTGAEETIRPLVRGAAALSSFLPMESLSTDSLSSFASSVLPSPIARQFPCLNAAMTASSSSVSSSNGKHSRNGSEESQGSSCFENFGRGAGPKVRVLLVREVTVDARAAGFGFDSPLDDVLGYSPGTSDFDIAREKGPRAGSHIYKSTVIGEGIVYSTSSLDSHPGHASWAGEVRVDPRLGIKTGGFQTRTLTVKDMLIVSISQPNLGRTSLHDFRQVIPLQFTTDDAYSDN